MWLHPICLLCWVNSEFSQLDASSKKFSRSKIYTFKTTQQQQKYNYLAWKITGSEVFFFWSPRRADPTPVIHREIRSVELKEIYVFYFWKNLCSTSSSFSSANYLIMQRKGQPYPCVSTYPAWIQHPYHFMLIVVADASPNQRSPRKIRYL